MTVFVLVERQYQGGYTEPKYYESAMDSGDPIRVFENKSDADEAAKMLTGVSKNNGTDDIYYEVQAVPFFGKTGVGGYS